MIEYLRFLEEMGAPGALIIVTAFTFFVCKFLRKPFIDMVDAWCDHIAGLRHWLRACIFCGHLLFLGVWVAMWMVCSKLYFLALQA